VTLCKLILITLLTTIVFILEFALSGLPNVNLTFVLLAVIFQRVEIKYHITFISLYIALQGIVWGFDLYLIPMFIAFIGYGIVTFFIKDMENMLQAFIIGGYAIIYSAMFIPINVYLIGVPLGAYIIADIPFTITLMINNFLTVLWLKPTLMSVYPSEPYENAL